MNYLDLGRHHLGFTRQVMYLDTQQHLAHEPLIRHGVRMKIGQVWKWEGEEYRLVMVWIPAWDMPNFVEAMEDLKIRMRCCGHPDYETHGSELLEDLLGAFPAWVVALNTPSDAAIQGSPEPAGTG